MPIAFHLVLWNFPTCDGKLTNTVVQVLFGQPYCWAYAVSASVLCLEGTISDQTSWFSSLTPFHPLFSDVQNLVHRNCVVGVDQGWVLYRHILRILPCCRSRQLPLSASKMVSLMGGPVKVALSCGYKYLKHHLKLYWLRKMAVIDPPLGTKTFLYTESWLHL